MHGFHFLLTLIKHHMLLLTQSGNQLTFINTNTVLHLLIHHLGNLMNKMFCLFLSNIITMAARCNCLMLCHTYFIELFEIGRIYRNKIYSLIQRKGIIIGFQQYPMIK